MTTFIRYVFPLVDLKYWREAEIRRQSYGIYKGMNCKLTLDIVTMFFRYVWFASPNSNRGHARGPSTLAEANPVVPVGRFVPKCKCAFRNWPIATVDGVLERRVPRDTVDLRNNERRSWFVAKIGFERYCSIATVGHPPRPKNHRVQLSYTSAIIPMKGLCTSALIPLKKQQA